MFLDENEYPAEERDYINRLNQNYEYCYLESMHHLASMEPVDTIITGLSYGINGFEPQLFTRKTLNLSMHSQDIFYDVLQILRCIEKTGNTIKNCVMSMGYYSLFYDLSYTGSNYKCLQTYYPLFDNTHHVAKEERDLSSIRDKSFIEYYHNFFGDNPSYYGEAILREYTNPEITLQGGWSRLSQEQKIKYSRDLCEKHNKHIKHISTFEENKALLYELWKTLEQKDINIYFVIMPFTKEYMSYIDPQYKKIALEMISNNPYRINYIDFNDYDLFEDADFLDSDHLNYDGAVKASQVIDEIIMGNI